MSTSRESDRDRVDVSVIIVSWNTRELLRSCVASLLENAGYYRFEVICVDNASTDGSVQMLRQRFPMVRIIASKTNLGFNAANNLGITISRSRYVLLLNPDTVVLAGAVGKIVDFADRHPDCAVVGGRVLNPDLSLQRSCFMYPSLLNMFLSATYLYKVFPRSRLFGRERMTWWDFDSVRDVEAVCGCFELVRRDSIECVGMMDPTYFIYGDEIDWCWRFRRAGWRIAYTPEPAVIHFGGQASMTMRRKSLLQLFGSILIFVRLHRPRGLFLFFRLLVGAFFLLRIPFVCLKCLMDPGNRKMHFEAITTYAIGCCRSLFDWKSLLMNRADVARNLMRHA